MKTFLTGVVIVAGFALAAPAAAAPGECSITGYNDFPCDISVDGGGITFDLPDGETFVFVHGGDDQGMGYLIPAQSDPGDRPRELGNFEPVHGEAGCWFGERDEITFCAALEQ